MYLSGMFLLLLAAPKIPDSPQPAWTAPVGLHPMYRLQAPIVSNGRLFFIAHNDFRNHLYALDAKSGAILWKTPFRATRVDLYPDDTLRVFTMDRYYLGVHAQTGQAFDSNDLLKQPNIYESNFYPLYVDGLTLIGSRVGELTALAPSGPKWKVQLGWKDNIVPTPPVAYKDLVIVGGGQSTKQQSGGLKAYSLRSGALVWSAADVKDATTIKVHGDVIIVAEVTSNGDSLSTTIRAVDAQTGKPLWSMPGEASVERSQSDGQILVIGPSDKPMLRVVDLHTGVLKFELTLRSTKFAFSQGTVYAVQYKQVVAIDPMNGKVLWQSAPFAEEPGTPIASEGFLYAGDRQTVSAWVVR